MSAGGITLGFGHLNVGIRFPDLGRASRDLARGLGDAARGIGVGVAAGLRGSAPAIRAFGASLSQVTRGLGTGLGTAIRSTSGPIRAMGSAFSGVVRSFGSSLGGVLRGSATLIRSFSGLLRVALSPLRTLTGAGRMLSLGGGIGAGGAAYFTARQAMSQEGHAADLARLTGLRGGDLQSLMGNLKNRASMTGTSSLEEMFGTAKMGAKLGIGGNQLGLFVRDMTEVKAALSDIPLEEFSERTARLMSVFGYGAKDTRRFASAMVALDNASTASARDILDISTRLAPMAQALGLSAQKTLALATATREAGVNPETAGTALSQVLGKMASPKHQAGFAKLAGTDMKEFAAMVRRDPLEAVKALAVGLDKLDSSSAMAALEKLQLDGARTKQVLLALSATVGKLDKFTSVSTRDFASMSAVQEAAALKANTASAAFERMWNQVKITAGELGEKFLPVLKAAADGLGALAKDLQSWTRANATMLSGWAAKIGDAVRMVGVLGREWETVMGIGKSFGTQGLDTFTKVASNFGSALWNNMKWAGQSFGRIMANVAAGIGRSLVYAVKALTPIVIAVAKEAAGAALQFIASNWKSAITMGGFWQNSAENTAAGAIAGFKADSLAKAFGNPLAGVGSAPGFGGLLNGVDDITKKAQGERAPMFAALQDAVTQQRKEAAQQQGRQNITDAIGRMLPGGKLDVGKIKPRPQNPYAGKQPLTWGFLGWSQEFTDEEWAAKRREWDDQHSPKRMEARARQAREKAAQIQRQMARAGKTPQGVRNQALSLGAGILGGGIGQLALTAFQNSGGVQSAAKGTADKFMAVLDKLGGEKADKVITLLEKLVDKIDFTARAG